MRKTRLLAASCYIKGDITGAQRLEANRRMILECLERAKDFRPDFVVFPEIALHAGVGTWKEALRWSEPAPGPSTQIVGQKARELASYVWLPMFERRGDKVHNSVVLLGRKGEVLGAYRKFHATGYEIEDGIQPGEEVPVWETDRGRMGCAVCFDLKFPEVGLRLSRGRAQVVFWPSMFRGGRRLVAWAMDYGFYLVKCLAGEGEIVDPCGNFIARGGTSIKLEDPKACLTWTFAEVNTDRKSYHLDFNQEKLPAILAKYGAGVDILRNEDEGTFSLASNLDGKTVEEIEKEFGLEDLRGYLDRAARIRESRLPGRGTGGG
ncbi:MAG: carbon-nitrogen hydrolase family protein [Planctomycetota bacterium]